MPLVEAELTSPRSLRGMSRNSFRIHTPSKVRQTAGPVGCAVCLRVCPCTCVQAPVLPSVCTPGMPLLKKEPQSCPTLPRARGACSRTGSATHNQDQLLFMFRRSCCMFRKLSFLPSNHPSLSLWGCSVLTVA